MASDFWSSGACQIALHFYSGTVTELEGVALCICHGLCFSCLLLKQWVGHNMLLKHVLVGHNIKSGSQQAVKTLFCHWSNPLWLSRAFSTGTRWRRRTWWCEPGECWRTGAGGYPTTGWALETTSLSTSSLWYTGTSSRERSTKSGYRMGIFLGRACKRQ